MPQTLFKKPWTQIKQKMILARMPRHAQPSADLDASAKSYTLEVKGKHTRIQVVLDKPIFYVKGSQRAVVERLATTFGVKFKMDRSGGVGMSCEADACGAYAHAMALAEWSIDDLETTAA